MTSAEPTLMPFARLQHIQDDLAAFCGIPLDFVARMNVHVKAASMPHAYWCESSGPFTDHPNHTVTPEALERVHNAAERLGRDPYVKLQSIMNSVMHAAPNESLVRIDNAAGDGAIQQAADDDAGGTSAAKSEGLYMEMGSRVVAKAILTEAFARFEELSKTLGKHFANRLTKLKEPATLEKSYSRPRASV